MYLVRVLAMFCLLAVGVLAPGAEASHIQASRAAAPVILDGKLDEPCWEDAQVLTKFVGIVSGEPAGNQTRGRVLYDDENLYIGVEADEPRMDLVVGAAEASRGKFIYRSGNTIEVFIGSSGRKEDFLQVLVNTSGEFQTWTTREMQLRNLGIEPAVYLGEDGFSMEIRIPLASLHLEPESGEIWGFNLCRARMVKEGAGPDEMYSSWSHSRGGFRNPDRFGEIKIKDFPEYWFDIIPVFEAGRAELKIINRTGKEEELLLETYTGKSVEARAGGLVPGESVVIPVRVESLHDFELDVNLMDRRTRTLLRRGGVFLSEIEPVSSPLPKASVRAPVDRRGYVVFTSSWLDRGNSWTLPDGGLLDKPVSVFGSPGEYAPASFSLRALRNLDNVEVKVRQAIINPEGAEIAEENVVIRTVEPMRRWFPVTQEFESVETYLPIAGKRDLAADLTHRYWVTVKIPEGAAPGMYEGEILISPSNAPGYNLPLKVEVSGVRLAEAEGMTYFTWFRPHRLAPELVSEEFYRSAYTNMREYGMTSVSIYSFPAGRCQETGEVFTDITRDRNPDWISMPVQMSLMEEAGLLKPWSPVPWVGAEVYGRGTWRYVYEQAQRRGWNELLWYIVDEPRPDQYDLVERKMEELSRLREGYPDFSIRTTTAIGRGADSIMHYYDVPILSRSTPYEYILDLQERGHEVWSYECALSPVDAHTLRYYFGLWAWKTGVKGVGLWAYYDGGGRNRFGTYAEWDGTLEDMRENDQRFNFVYPLAGGEIVPSIGWEGAREGIDDYRYLLTLERTIEAAEAAGAEEAALSSARGLLARIDGMIEPDRLAGEQLRLRAASGEPGARPNMHHFERRPPQEELTPEKYEELRRLIVSEISMLNRTGYEH